jgi:hypothetical protein
MTTANRHVLNIRREIPLKIVGKRVHRVVEGAEEVARGEGEHKGA